MEWFWPEGFYTLAMVGVFAVAFLLRQLDTTFCNPGSGLQMHAAWHVATGIGIYLAYSFFEDVRWNIDPVSGLQRPDDGLRLLARHPALEVGVLGVVGTAPQGGQGDAEEGVALLRRHLPDAVEVTEAGGDKVEVLGVLV